MDDPELNRLLREWTAPGAPPGLRPRPARRSLWPWLVAGTIRVPVPVALVAVLLAAAWVGWPRPGSSVTPRTSAPRPSGELARYPLTGDLQGFDAVIVQANFQPGVSAPGASSSRPHRRVRRGWADEVFHQPRAGQDRARRRHVLRTARRPAHLVRLCGSRCARAHRGLPGGPHWQSADRARGARREP